MGYTRIRSPDDLAGKARLDLGTGVNYDTAMAMIIDETNIPRYAMFRGRRVRVTGYDSDTQKFTIADTDDSTRTVFRGQITFVAERGSAREAKK